MDIPIDTADCQRHEMPPHNTYCMHQLQIPVSNLELEYLKLQLLTAEKRKFKTVRIELFNFPQRIGQLL